MIAHFLNVQFVSFLGVGLLAASLHWLYRFFLSGWFPFNVAVIIAYLLSIISAFLLNKILVFPGETRKPKTQMRDFFLIHVAYFPVVWGASALFIVVLPAIGITVHVEGLAHAIAIAIPIFTSFLLYKFVVFRTEVK